jgi:kinesin family protein 4/21/27
VTLGHSSLPTPLSSQGDSPSHQFTYDAVFPEAAGQERVYREAAGGMLDAVLAGYNATILAYGQTGSGKTYTMGSDSRGGGGYGDGGRLPEGTGNKPRFVKDLFDELEGERRAEAQAGEAEAAGAAEGGAAPAGDAAPAEAPATSTSVACSFLEVYGEDVHDLLSPPPPNSASPSLPLREDPSGVSVIGLSHVPVSSPADALDVLRRGTMHRTTAATLMNKTSSRSHAVFTVVLSRTTELPLQGDAPEGARKGTTTTQ